MAGSFKQKVVGWKEIAAFLEREVRTAQRWEREAGLPVHRVPGKKGHTVFAYPQEIEAWLSGHPPEAGTGPLVGDRDGSPIPPKQNSEQLLSQEFVLAGSSSSTSEPTNTTDGPKVLAAPGNEDSGRVRAKFKWFLPLVASALALGAIELVWTRVQSPKPISALSFDGDSLQARDDSGHLLWVYDFRQPLRVDLESQAQRFQVANLGESKQGNVLAVPPLLIPSQSAPSSDALYSFSMSGNLRWRHSFEDTLRFGEAAYGPPWEFGALMTDPGERSHSIWCAVDSEIWSPSILVKLNQEGRELARFVNWGHIRMLSHVRDSFGSFILAGGINNECHCAMLAVLREDKPSGSSPALARVTTSCTNCPKGEPYRYLLFPHSELTELSGAAYNQVAMVQTSRGHVRVFVNETQYEGPPPGADWKMYDLGGDFVPRGAVEVSDHYWAFHRVMEAGGKIQHNIAECPERTRSDIIKLWSPENGWREVALPPLAQ